MNERLKDLIARGNMDVEKVRALLAMLDNDEQWVEQLLRNADVSQKAALAAGVSFKAVAPDMTALVSQLEDLAQRLDDLLTQLDGMQTPVVEQKRSDPAAQHTPAIGGLTAQKSYNPATDFLSRALGADQVTK